MTYEELTEALKEKGYRIKKINGNEKFINDIVDILTSSDNGVEMVKKENEEIKERLIKENERLNALDREITRKMKEVEQKLKQVEEIKKENEMLRHVKECETAEGRDKARLAVIFVRAINRGLTEPLFAEYINGLGRILAANKEEI